jgi:hypothetical protein
MLSIKEFLFGYNDDFLNLISKIRWGFKAQDVSLLASKEGISRDDFTINLGTKKLEDTGFYAAVNGKVRHNIWKTEKCNRIEGSEGVFYGPSAIRNKRDVFIYLPEFCRTFPLRFEKEVRFQEFDRTL